MALASTDTPGPVTDKPAKSSGFNIAPPFTFFPHSSSSKLQGCGHGKIINPTAPFNAIKDKPSVGAGHGTKIIDK